MSEEERRFDAALVEEACRKSGLVWLALPGSAGERPAWHVWHEGAVWVVHGGREQPLPGLQGAPTVLVTVRSKDKGGRLVSFTARAQDVAEGTPEWAGAAAVLRAKRLNAPDGEAQVERWARESVLTRLEPTGEVPERPGAMPDGSLAAAPRPTPATTLARLPFVLGRRRGRRTGA